MTARSSDTACAMRSVTRDALVLGRAQRRDAAGEAAALRALGLEQRAQRQQVVGQRLEQARPLAAELVAAQRPGELAGARRAARDERDERAQLVLGVRLRSRARRAGARRCRRSPSVHGPAPLRSHATGPSATRAGSNSRSALSSRRKRTRASVSGAGSPGSLVSVRHASTRGLVGARRPDGVGRRVRRAPRRATSDSPSPSAISGEAIRRPSSGATTTDSARPVEQRALDLVVRALEALGRDDELRRLAEDAADEDAQRRRRRARADRIGMRGSPCSRR